MGKRFLIGQLGRFGDCLFATTIAKQIKHDFPDSHLTWAVTPKYRPILELNPHVDQIWEVDADDNTYDNSGWERFEKAALEKQDNGEFDEVILSQISPKNWINFTGTIRGTILSSYQKPITVSVSPIVQLSQDEIENVNRFAETNRLDHFKNVILFECSPGSGQSRVDLEFAQKVASLIIQEDPNICFIFSTPQKLQTENKQIIDASELSFRENAELIKYCSMLVGCGSGISWLSTAENVPQIPTIELLDAKFYVYAGMHHDLEVNRLPTDHLLEMTDFNEFTTAECIDAVLQHGISAAKNRFHQSYSPNYFHLKNLTKGLIEGHKNPKEIAIFSHNFIRINQENRNPIAGKYKLLLPYLRLYGIFYRRVKASKSGLVYNLRQFIKSKLWQK